MRARAAGAASARGSVRAVVAVCAALFVDSLLYSIVVPVLPAYAERLGASKAAIGALFASYAVGLLAATPLAAAVSDRAGRRAPLLVGSLGIVGATLLFAAATSYPLLVTARLAQGAAAAAVWAAGVALLADVVAPGHLGKAMGAAMGSMSAGLILGPTVGGLLAETLGRRAPFLVAAAVTTVSFMLQLVLAEDPAARGARPRSPCRLLSDRALLGTVAGVTLAALSLSMLEPLLPLDLADRLGLGAAGTGLVFGAATLAHGLVSPGVGALADRCRGPWVIAAGLVAMGAALPLLARSQSAFQVGAVLVALAVAYSLVVVPALAELASVVRAHDSTAYAAVYAAFNVAYSIGMVAGPLAGGAAASRFSIATTFQGAGVLLGGGGLLLALSGCAPPHSRGGGPRRLVPERQQPVPEEMTT